ncbi:MAG: hypothetical protein FJX76_03495 [Armatimonadetes bacterium]|nr:hypothetical protein [Armatimonadota bacterium]
MDRWSKWQAEVNADMEIIKATLKSGAEAVQARLQEVQESLSKVQGTVNDVQRETAKQDVAVLEALGRFQQRFN